ncbi:MAG: GGDEF domain-containing protein [Desulfobacterales bacterium]|nr:GGDEF domain-containing protein [Desulfobacterales bacterium]MCP4163182.1 GGDEF domain-containing protein [Deltaproteobacteria bacterium]
MGEPKEVNEISLDSEFEDQIYKCLDQGIKLHAFPNRLEKMYLRHYRKSRIKRFAWLGVIGLIFYNLFLMSDKAMLPDIFIEASITRVFIVTPLILLSIAGLFIKKIARFVDLIAGAIILFASVSIMYFLLISNSPNVNNYHTGLIISVVVANIVLRLRFRYAVFYTLLIFFLFVLTVHNIPLMNQETVNNSILVLFTVACFTLIGNYQIENENRFTYLNSLLRRINAAKLKESNKKLKNIAITDALTGLTNRRHFDISLEKEWKACRRSQKNLSLIFIDIDFFKNYNDNYGHQKGDECLQKVAKQLCMNVKRPRDILARYGGEEFVVLIPETDTTGTMQLAEEIRGAIEELKIPHEFSDGVNLITISLGVATLLPSDEKTFLDLIQLADIALYEAKNQGRNIVYLHPESC